MSFFLHHPVRWMLIRPSRKPRKQANLQNAIMQLRKICNHPFVFREVDEDFTVGSNIDEQIVRTAGKFELLDRLLPKLFKTGHKVRSVSMQQNEAHPFHLGLDLLPDDGNHDDHRRLLRLSRLEILPARRFDKG